MNASNSALLSSTRKVKKMNKKLLTIAIIALVIFVIVSVPVAATLPTTSPLPSGKPYELIWKFLQDLQNQIKNIQLTPGPQGPPGKDGATGATGPAGPAGQAGATVHFGAWQEIDVDVDSGQYIIGSAEIDGIVTVSCSNYVPTFVSGWRCTGSDCYIVASSDAQVWTDDMAHASITMPVRQGDGYMVFWRDCTHYLSVQWLPLSA
jgi:hypothetical protein